MIRDQLENVKCFLLSYTNNQPPIIVERAICMKFLSHYSLIGDHVKSAQRLSIVLIQQFINAHAAFCLLNYQIISVR